MERARGRWLAITLGTVATTLLLSALSGERGWVRISALKKELHETGDHNFQLVQSISRLRSQLERIRTDDAALEKLARRRLSLVREGEVIYKLPVKNQAPAPAPPAHD